MKSFQALILNTISLLLGVIRYDELVIKNPEKYPEAVKIKETFEQLSDKFEKLKIRKEDSQ